MLSCASRTTQQQQSGENEVPATLYILFQKLECRRYNTEKMMREYGEDSDMNSIQHTHSNIKKPIWAVKRKEKKKLHISAAEYRRMLVAYVRIML